MKISIKNFGPIDHFELDLEKDLHVIYGENNIGKSWAINLAYILLKVWKQHLSNIPLEEFKLFLEENIAKRLQAWDTIDYKFEESLNSSLYNTFGEVKNLFSDQDPEINITTDLIQLNIQRIYTSGEVGGIIEEFAPSFNIDIKAKEKSIKSLVAESVSTFNFDNFFFLPASKSGIYQILSNMGNIFAKLSQYRSQLKDSSLQLPSMSEPVSDYILNISDIQVSKQGNFKDLVNFLEENIIEGKVTFDEFQKKLKYKSTKTGLDLELHEASSMIAEVSPLVAYLKYILPKSNAILFIEEPEAHLHPKIQVEMMKVFVQLVKAGVKVVMTTHSDFMMNELSNLLLEGTISAENVASYHLKMGEKGSFDAGDMKATDEGIEDYNFTDVAIELYERRMKIIEKMNQDAIREN